MNQGDEKKIDCRANLQAETRRVIYNFPPTKWAVTGTVSEQLIHMMSEVDEILELGPLLDSSVGIDPDFSAACKMLEMEIVDLYHSIETLFRIIERSMGSAYVDAIFAAVEEKNRSRGYYDLENRGMAERF